MWSRDSRVGHCQVFERRANSEANWVRVAGIIHDGLPDLVKMPSAPPAEFHRGIFGEMTLGADGQVLAQQDIRIEREGATYGH